VRLDELLAEEALGLRLCGRPDHASRPLSWAFVVEMPDPGRWLGGGEIALTTGISLTDPSAQATFVHELADVGAAALGFAPGGLHPTIPPAIEQAAAERDLPLVEVPFETRFRDITNVVCGSVARERYEQIDRALKAHDELARLVLDGHGTVELVDRLAELIERPLILFDADVEELARAGTGRAWPDELVPRILEGRARDHPWRVAGTGIWPVLVGDDIEALVAVRRPEPRDRQVMTYAVTLLGLQLDRERSAHRDRAERLGAAVTAIVERSEPIATIERRLTGLGVETDRAHVVLVVGTPGDAGATGFWSVTRALMRALPVPVLTGRVDDRTVAIATTTDPTAVASALSQQLGRLGQGAAVGVSAAHTGVAPWRIAYFEALDAAHRGPGVHRYTAQSISRLLLVAGDVPARELAASLLAPLDEHDQKSSADLIDTLRAFFRHDGTMTATADELGIHRHTLRYRLDRIAELSGRDPRRSEDLVELHLALLLTRAERAPGHG